MGKAIWHKQKMLYCGTERSQRSDYDNAVHAHHAMWLPLTLTGLCDRTAWTIILFKLTSLTNLLLPGMYIFLTTLCFIQNLLQTKE